MSKIIVHKLPLPSRKESIPSPESRGSRPWHAIYFELFAVLRLPEVAPPMSRLPPPPTFTSRTPRTRRGASVVKCLRACLGVRGTVFFRRDWRERGRELCVRRHGATAPLQANSSGRWPRAAIAPYPYRKFRPPHLAGAKCARRRLCRARDDYSQCYIRAIEFRACA